MKKQLQNIDYENLIKQMFREDHRICDEVFLMGDFQLEPTVDYEFVAPENMFIEVFSGKGYIIVNGIKHEVDGHSLIAYLKGQSITVRTTNRRIIQRGAAFTDSFMESLYRGATKFNDIRLSIIMNPVICIEEEQALGLNIYARVLRGIAKKENKANNLMCVKMATLALFYGPLYDVLKRKIESDTLRCPSLSSQFFILLESNFLSEHNLGFYADAIGISKTYLYDCVMSTTGKAPGYWIDYYMISFAKHSLADMDLSIQQIAMKLHFSGLPQFGKFFRKQTGMSPSNYRKSLV